MTDVICSSVGYFTQCLRSSQAVIQKELIIPRLLSPRGRVLVTYLVTLSHYLFKDFLIKVIGDSKLLVMEDTLDRKAWES